MEQYFMFNSLNSKGCTIKNVLVQNSKVAFWKEPFVQGCCPSHSLEYSWVHLTVRRTASSDKRFLSKGNFQILTGDIFFDHPLLSNFESSFRCSHSTTSNWTVLSPPLSTELFQCEPLPTIPGVCLSVPTGLASHRHRCQDLCHYTVSRVHS